MTLPPVNTRACGSRGFTIVELLVVVAIIVVIAGFLYSALVSARTSARKKQNETLLYQLAAAVKQMKATYKFSGPLGVDADGQPLDDAELEAIDIGWELDPKNPLWGPGGESAEDLHFNKRRLRFYEVKRRQVMNGHLVDVFGNPVRYYLETREVTNPDGENVTIVDEYLVSAGPDGEFELEAGDSDDQRVKIGSFTLRNE